MITSAGLNARRRGLSRESPRLQKQPRPPAGAQFWSGPDHTSKRRGGPHSSARASAGGVIQQSRAAGTYQLQESAE